MCCKRVVSREIWSLVENKQYSTFLAVDFVSAGVTGRQKCWLQVRIGEQYEHERKVDDDHKV